jgi:single-stranded-DNA-specific exonuclease
MHKKWVLKKQTNRNIIAHILSMRGIKSKKAQERFLSPRYERDLFDPFLIKGMKKAVARIEKALEKREKIGIFGDYDVDGVCGSTILYDFLAQVGVTPKFETYLPDRSKDGYGLNLHGIEHFKKQGITLMITVDCGISDHKEIEWAMKNGIDVIVTDHHEVAQGLPPAYAIVNPKRKDDTYPFRELAGTGVAFKLVQALRISLKNEHITEAWEKWLLDLVAFATVADQMPLLEENRALVKYGLIVLAKTQRLGFQELMKVARLNPQEITTQDFLFQLAPRVNSASRMDHAFKAFQLFVTKDRNEARELAKDIDASNKKRQRFVAKALKEVKERVEKKIAQIEKDQLILEGSPDWPAGVCGLVAQRLLDHYGYPTFIYTLEGTAAKGSVRSLPPFSVVDTMKKADKLLIDWGGHHQAGGFSIEPKNLEAFKRIIAKQTASASKKIFTPSLAVSAELEAKDITLDLWDRLQLLQPFGKENPEPTFLLKQAYVHAVRKVGKDQDHFKITLKKDDHFFEAIYFRGVADNHLLKEGDSADVVFELKRSAWSRVIRAELSIVDLKRNNESSSN